MFERSKLESLRDVSVTRIGDTLSYGFPQTAFAAFMISLCPAIITISAHFMMIRQPVIGCIISP